MILALCSQWIVAPDALRDKSVHIFRNQELRKSHYPLISGETFRSAAKFIFDETQIPFDPYAVNDGDTIFVAMTHLNYFLEKVMPHIPARFILITSNGSGTIDQNYLHILEEERLIGWYGRNMTLLHQKAHLIPLGVCWNNNLRDTSYLKQLNTSFNNLKITDFFKEKPIHTYLNILQSSHPYREKIFDYFSTQKFCQVERFRKCFKEYLSDLSRSRFVISPRGVNLDCYRTWEALYAGSIPVVESCGIDGLYEDLPVIVVDNLTQVTEECLDATFEKMKSRSYDLSKLHADYWLFHMNFFD